jgi:hypothetical protein
VFFTDARQQIELGALRCLSRISPTPASARERRTDAGTSPEAVNREGDGIVLAHRKEDS